MPLFEVVLEGLSFTDCGFYDKVNRRISLLFVISTERQGVSELGRPKKFLFLFSACSNAGRS